MCVSVCVCKAGRPPPRRVMCTCGGGFYGRRSRCLRNLALWARSEYAYEQLTRITKTPTSPNKANARNSPEPPKPPTSQTHIHPKNAQAAVIALLRPTWTLGLGCLSVLCWNNQVRRAHARACVERRIIQTRANLCAHIHHTLFNTSHSTPTPPPQHQKRNRAGSSRSFWPRAGGPP